MKKILFIVVPLLVLLVGYQILDEPIPDGQEGPQAEQLADNILNALNKPAWDTLQSISWTYPLGDHHYFWNKSINKVEMSWDDYSAQLNTDTGDGIVFKSGELVTNDKELVHKAFKLFYNDSFWLIAPYKIKDPGTARKIVEHNGREALLVQYASGGYTPGDSYLWIVDDNFRPTAWKFWASIIPVGGMKFTWEKWVDVNGALISTYHSGIIDIQIDVGVISSP